MSQFSPHTAHERIQRLIVELDSLVDGELAAAQLVAMGRGAVPYIERFLLEGQPRTIALPRCRAVRALGELGARPALVAYFRRYQRPADAAVLFAEDAVRSVAARELLRWKSNEVFEALLNAAAQRATGGLLLALGEFCDPRCIPLFFRVLEDDLCREEAKSGLRKMPDAARHYAILSIRGLTSMDMSGPFALRRCRATLQLLQETGVALEEWKDLRRFLSEQDADVVIATATIGLSIHGDEECEPMLRALFRVAERLNWVQESQVAELFDAHSAPAKRIAQLLLEERKKIGEHPNWLSPFWRIVRHILGEELEAASYGAA